MLTCLTAIQSPDKEGNIGTFGYTGTYPKNYKQISPTFKSCIGLFDWLRDNGFILEYKLEP